MDKLTGRYTRYRVFAASIACLLSTLGWNSIPAYSQQPNATDRDPPANAVTDFAGQYSTDWFAPLLTLSDDLVNVSRVDLSIEPFENDTAKATLTFYIGEPAYDAFGDANPDQLEQRELNATLTRVDDVTDMFSLGRSLYMISVDGVELPSLELALCRTLAADSRLLVNRTAGEESSTYDRILPLRSPRFDADIAALPPTNVGKVSLDTCFFPLPGGQWCYVSVSGADGEFHYTRDRNKRSYNRFGDAVSSTLMGFLPQKIELRKLPVADTSGQNRSVYELRSECDEPNHTMLVLHPQLGGLHRLLKRDGDSVQWNVPAFSSRLRRRLETRLKVDNASPAVREAFERIRDTLPEFDGFVFEENRVVMAELSDLDETNEQVLEYLSRLPHLHTLLLDECNISGKHLPDLQSVKHFGFGDSEVSEQTLRHIGLMISLESLWLSRSTVHCGGFRHLETLQRLRHFSFRRGAAGESTVGFEDSCVDVFSKLPELEELDLGSLPVTESTIERLPRTPKLKSVRLDRTAPLLPAIRYAAAVPGADVIIESFSLRLKNGTLRLPAVVRDEDLHGIAELKELRHLELPFAKHITDAGLSHLVDTELISLELRSVAGVTDEGVALISSIQTLESLDVTDCQQLTDESVRHLKRLPNLKMFLFGSTGINAKTVQTELPHCNVK